jgi:hypothetical protein
MACAIAQEVCRRVGFETWSSHVGPVVARAALGQVISEYFVVPTPQSSSYIMKESSLQRVMLT